MAMVSYVFALICLLSTYVVTSEASSIVKSSVMRSFRKYVTTTFAAGAFFLPPSLPAHAARTIGEVPTSGFIFKDTLKVQEFEDPKIKGVAIYLADFDRPINEKLTSNFFNDPSSSSLSCSKTGPITVGADVNTGTQGEDVFEESKNLFFKVSITYKEMT